MNIKNTSTVILIKGICLTPWMDLWGGIKRSKFTFLEHSHIAYQIKENIPGDGVSRSKFQLFQNMVMLHIKLKRVNNAAT